jgi:hypothetical protein
MLSSCVRGRARKTLVGVGRELRRLSSSDGVVSKPHLLQVLRTYHLGLTVEVSSKLKVYQVLKLRCIVPVGYGSIISATNYHGDDPTQWVWSVRGRLCVCSYWSAE